MLQSEKMWNVKAGADFENCLGTGLLHRTNRTNRTSGTLVTPPPLGELKPLITTMVRKWFSATPNGAQLRDRLRTTPAGLVPPCYSCD